MLIQIPKRNAKRKVNDKISMIINEVVRACESARIFCHKLCSNQPFAVHKPPIYRQHKFRVSKLGFQKFVNVGKNTFANSCRKIISF